MKVNEIYKKYNINKGLQEHMLRVAAVSKLICDNFDTDLDKENVVNACLLHDMANLIKSKLDSAPELFEPEGIEYWEGVKNEMISKYGNNVHEATSKIVSEVTNEEKINILVSEMAFDAIKEIAEKGKVEVKIALYSDMRVGMYGIISLDERFDDIKERYVPRGRFSAEEIEARREAAKRIEDKIFTHCKIKPEDINDESTKVIQQGLLGVEI